MEADLRRFIREELDAIYDDRGRRVMHFADAAALQASDRREEAATSAFAA